MVESNNELVSKLVWRILELCFPSQESEILDAAAQILGEIGVVNIDLHLFRNSVSLGTPKLEVSFHSLFF